MEFNLPIRRIVLLLLSFGLLFYLLGSFLGFFWSYFSYLIYFSESKSFYVAPFSVFELYPRFVLAYSNVWPPIFYEKFSMFSIIFFAASIIAILSALLNKTMLALIFSFLASVALITHYGLIGFFVGFQPAGFEVKFTTDVVAVFNVFYLVFSSKNLSSIILAIIMYVVGANLLSFKVYKQKIEQLSLAQTLKQKFQKLRSINRSNRAAFPIGYFILLFYAWYDWLAPLEFPYYNPISHFWLTFWYGFIYFFILISVPAVLEHRATIQSRKLLAEALIPLLERKLMSNSPLIQIWDFKSELGLDSIDRVDFRLVLKNSLKMIGQKENIRFGFLRNYFYFVEPLVDIAKEKIKRDGQADIEEIAIEIGVNPINLKEAYKKIVKKKMFENVKIVRGKILPVY